MKMLEGKAIENDNFRRIVGSEVNLSWLEHDESAMKEPVVIEDPEGLGLKMPSDELTIQGIAEILGEDTPIEVIGTVHCRLVGEF
jgi:F-box/leucine-rich repeat protein 10/11